MVIGEMIDFGESDKMILYDVFDPPSLSELADALKNFFKFGRFLNFPFLKKSRFLFFLSE